MQYKAQYYFTGAIEILFPETSREYTDKKGNKVTTIERKAIIVNKYKKNGFWRVTYAEFSFKGESAEKLRLFIPRQEIIVSFTIRGIFYNTRNTNEKKFFQMLEAFDVFSPKDKIMPEKWMNAKNFEPVSDPKSPDSSMKLSEEERIKRNPPGREYNSENYIREADYSVNKSPKNDFKQPLPEIKADEKDELPF